MEAHPVPQNVTQFEFHLIGNMTMRQFGYLAVGMGLAYVIFILFATTLPYIAYPLIVICASLGAAYAFLPIMDRPLDHWTAAFIKAITKPTMRKYESKRLGAQDPRFSNRLELYLQQIQAPDNPLKRAAITSIHTVYSGPRAATAPEDAAPEPVKSEQPPKEEHKQAEAQQPVEEAPKIVEPPLEEPQPVHNQATPEPAPETETKQVVIDFSKPEENTADSALEHEKAKEAVNNFLNDLSTLAKQQGSQSIPEHVAQVQVHVEQPHQEVIKPTPPPPPLPPLPVLTQPPAHTPVPAPQITHPAPQIEPLINLPSTDELLSPALPQIEPKNEEFPSKEELDKTVQLAKQAQLVQSQILAAEKQIDTIKTGAAHNNVDPQKYTQEFQSVLSTLQKLNEKARDISHDLAELSKNDTSQNLVREPVSKPNIIPTLTLTQIPNILNGIVTDSQGNYIESAIVVAHDKQGLPVRALKTNKLGQFIAATPLPSGTYTISIEKDDMAFDVIQVELNDKVLNPIVISAKRGES
jgi:hypothetical protein